MTDERKEIIPREKLITLIHQLPENFFDYTKSSEKFKESKESKEFKRSSYFFLQSYFKLYDELVGNLPQEKLTITDLNVNTLKYFNSLSLIYNFPIEKYIIEMEQNKIKSYKEIENNKERDYSVRIIFEEDIIFSVIPLNKINITKNYFLPIYFSNTKENTKNDYLNILYLERETNRGYLLGSYPENIDPIFIDEIFSDYLATYNYNYYSIRIHQKIKFFDRWKEHQNLVLQLMIFLLSSILRKKYEISLFLSILDSLSDQEFFDILLLLINSPQFNSKEMKFPHLDFFSSPDKKKMEKIYKLISLLPKKIFYSSILPLEFQIQAQT